VAAFAAAFVALGVFVGVLGHANDAVRVALDQEGSMPEGAVR